MGDGQVRPLDEAFGRDWLEVLPHAMAMTAGEGPGPTGLRSESLTAVVHRMLGVMRRAGSARWTEEVVRVSIGPGNAFDPNLRTDEPWGDLYSIHGTLASGLKAIRVAHAAASGDGSALSRSERVAATEWFDSVLVPGRVATLVRVACDVVPTGDGHVPDRVEALVPWRGVRRGSRISQAVATTTVVVPLTETASADAPPVLRLLSLDGHEVVVRRMGDAFLRPVLAPGTWRPVTVDEFVEAASRGVAWMDSPFVGRIGDGSARLSVSDVATGDVRTDAASAEARAEARVEAARRAGALHAIDGVVHREVPPPRFGPVTVPGTPDEPRGITTEVTVRMGWWFEDGLGFLSEQSTLTPRRRVALHRAFPSEFSPWSFGAADVPAATALVGEWMAAPVPQAPLPARWRLRHDPVPSHEVLEPDAFEADRALAARSLAWACGTFGGRKPGRHVQLRQVGDAAAAQARGEAVEADALAVAGATHAETSRHFPVDVAGLLATLSDAARRDVEDVPEDVSSFRAGP